MRFTDTNITPADTARICAESVGGDKGYLTPPQINDIESAPYNAGSTVTGDININRDNGLLQKLILTGATVGRTFNVPTNGNEGETITVRIKNTTGVERTLAYHASILIPSDSAATFPKTLNEGETYVTKLYYNGAAWELLTLVGGYA